MWVSIVRRKAGFGGTMFTRAWGFTYELSSGDHGLTCLSTCMYSSGPDLCQCLCMDPWIVTHECRMWALLELVIFCIALFTYGLSFWSLSPGQISGCRPMEGTAWLHHLGHWANLMVLFVMVLETRIFRTEMILWLLVLNCLCSFWPFQSTKELFLYTVKWVLQ